MTNDNNKTEAKNTMSESSSNNANNEPQNALLTEAAAQADAERAGAATAGEASPFAPAEGGGDGGGGNGGGNGDGGDGGSGNGDDGAKRPASVGSVGRTELRYSLTGSPDELAKQLDIAARIASDDMRFSVVEDPSGAWIAPIGGYFTQVTEGIGSHGVVNIDSDEFTSLDESNLRVVRIGAGGGGGAGFPQFVSGEREAFYPRTEPIRAIPIRFSGIISARGPISDLHQMDDTAPGVDLRIRQLARVASCVLNNPLGTILDMLRAVCDYLMSTGIVEAVIRRLTGRSQFDSSIVATYETTRQHLDAASVISTIEECFRQDRARPAFGSGNHAWAAIGEEFLRELMVELLTIAAGHKVPLPADPKAKVLAHNTANVTLDRVTTEVARAERPSHDVHIADRLLKALQLAILGTMGNARAESLPLREAMAAALRDLHSRIDKLLDLCNTTREAERLEHLLFHLSVYAKVNSSLLGYASSGATAHSSLVLMNVLEWGMPDDLHLSYTEASDRLRHYDGARLPVEGIIYNKWEIPVYSSSRLLVHRQNIKPIADVEAQRLVVSGTPHTLIVVDAPWCGRPDLFANFVYSVKARPSGMNNVAMTTLRRERAYEDMIAKQNASIPTPRIAKLMEIADVKNTVSFDSCFMQLAESYNTSKKLDSVSAMRRATDPQEHLSPLEDDLRTLAHVVALGGEVFLTPVSDDGSELPAGHVSERPQLAVIISVPTTGRFVPPFLLQGGLSKVTKTWVTQLRDALTILCVDSRLPSYQDPFAEEEVVIVHDPSLRIAEGATGISGRIIGHSASRQLQPLQVQWPLKVRKTVHLDVMGVDTRHELAWPESEVTVLPVIAPALSNVNARYVRTRAHLLASAFVQLLAEAAFMQPRERTRWECLPLGSGSLGIQRPAVEGGVLVFPGAHRKEQAHLVAGKLGEWYNLSGVRFGSLLSDLATLVQTARQNRALTQGETNAVYSTWVPSDKVDYIHPTSYARIAAAGLKLADAFHIAVTGMSNPMYSPDAPDEFADLLQAYGLPDDVVFILKTSIQSHLARLMVEV